MNTLGMTMFGALDQSWTFPGCPTPPGWQVDWHAVQNQHTWLRALADVPQDPAYHAEGDVLIHTGMVASALVALAQWRALPPVERNIVFAAALLHDIAKERCTVVEDGRIKSPGHARRGEKLARALLWQDQERTVPFPCREAIARLVRHHGLPLWFWDKPDPLRAVIAASTTTQLAHVALLAEADVRGRICADQAELIERVEVFRLFCHEHGCYARPFPFANDHSRFGYFRSPGRDPHYAAHDDTWGEVTVLGGLPGAGKDTWIADHAPNMPVIALDVIRRELNILPQDDQGTVVRAAKERARALLRARQPFAWNATNITRSLRDPLINLITDYGARVHLVYIDASVDVLLRRNRERAATVPETILRRLMDKLDLPDRTEAHRVTYVYAQDR